MTNSEMELVVRRSARLAGLLAATDAPVRRIAYPEAGIARASRHTQLVRWRIAAAIVLLVAGAAGVPPVRAWIIARAGEIWSTIGGSRQSAAPAGAVVAPPADTMGSVTFAPPQGSIVIRVSSRQIAGELAIETVTDSMVSASVTGARQAAELLIMPDGLRILNSRDATAGYLVRIPASLSRVTVQVGSEVVQTLRPAAGQRWTVDLGVRNQPKQTLKD